jgi:uncharacterized lipoprotein YddW (UPF0748 family)
MKYLLTSAAGWWAVLLAAELSAATVYLPGQAAPPLPEREFRGVWVATVNNIDWPSKPNLPVWQQKAELLAILDRALALRLNAVIFQVRPACDAFYTSKVEPWSEYLTGEMGRAPQPLYDPLEFAVTEAHRRGLELHAWFNPFRVRHSSGSSPVSSRHVSRTHPEFVQTYGKQLWLDPGKAAARDFSLNVILDVVRRYDIDGVHLDDYFYPYPEKDASGRDLDFPDELTWRRSRQNGENLSQADWRRANVNTFIHRLYQAIKEEKSWVKFGVSPFGIWRPGFPASVRGLDAYDRLFADARHWLAAGWLDYLSPQLYWTIDAPNQSYPVLLQWWVEQNTQHRHLWPGNSVHRAMSQPGEISAQIRVTRRNAGASGNLLWSMSALQPNKGGAGSELVRSAYTQPALVPASPWLSRQLPQKPTASTTPAGSGWTISWQAAGPEHVSLWLLQCKESKGWTTEIIPGSQTSRRLSSRSGLPAAVSIRAVDRCGNLSAPAVLEKASR